MRILFYGFILFVMCGCHRFGEERWVRWEDPPAPNGVNHHSQDERMPTDPEIRGDFDYLRKEPEIELDYNELSGKGFVAIDTKVIGFDSAKARAMKMIEEIVTTRGLAIMAGQKPTGGRYILKGEEVKDGVLRIDFEIVD